MWIDLCVAWPMKSHDTQLGRQVVGGYNDYFAFRCMVNGAGAILVTVIDELPLHIVTHCFFSQSETSLLTFKDDYCDEQVIQESSISMPIRLIHTYKPGENIWSIIGRSESTRPHDNISQTVLSKKTLSKQSRAPSLHYDCHRVLHGHGILVSCRSASRSGRSHVEGWSVRFLLEFFLRYDLHIFLWTIVEIISTW